MIDPKIFVTAGKSIFTVESVKTGARYTYRVNKCKNNPELFFVSLLTGPDNTSDYTYLGIIRDGKFSLTGKSKMRKDSVPVIAFDYLWSHIDRLPEGLKFLHAGRCCRCARLLTVPESVESGIGPECAGKMF